MTTPGASRNTASSLPRDIRFPPPLFKGDRVAVIAPSSPFDREAFEAGVAALRRIGLEPVVREDVFAKEGYLAGSDADRARSLERAFTDPGVKGVFCARGGYGSMRMLPYIKADALKAPRVFMGFSDVTALLCFLYARCNMAVFHGPVVASLGEEPEETLQGLAALFL